jgi:predicted  nucleic acid-binding Zn-ribbon protein
LWFVPDAPSDPDEVAGLRAANARLRQVIEAKDTEVEVLRAQLEALAVHVAELRARLGRNSGNSSMPSSAQRLAGRPRSCCGASPGARRGSPGRRWR